MRIAVIDAYTDAGRALLARGGCTTAGDLYERVLAERDPSLGVDVLFPNPAARTLPEAVSAGDYAGVLWTGSNLTIHRDDAEVRAQIDLARTLLDAGVANFGSCWAAQLAAVVAGGACAAHPRGREFGVSRKIRLTDAGRQHPMFEGKPSSFDAFTSHEDQVVSLPSTATLLAENNYCEVQALSVPYGRSAFWAVQYHPEYDLREVARLGAVRSGQLVKEGTFKSAESADAYFADLEALHEAPGSRDLEFRLGVDADVLDPSMRCREVDNWLAALRSGAFRA